MNLPVVVLRVMLGKINAQFFCAWFPENVKAVLFDSIFNPIEAHVYGFYCFWRTILFVIPRSAEFSVFIGVSG